MSALKAKPRHGHSNSNGSNSGSGTEFMSILAPPEDLVDGYDNSKSHSDPRQPDSVPQIFHDAMSVREEVYGEQGVPLEAEFDNDDRRSWHWVVYASVATSSSSPPKSASITSTPKGGGEDGNGSGIDGERRPSSTATRLPVGTVRLIPPPHGPNPYLPTASTESRPDAEPPSDLAKHPIEPYIKLGRLAVLTPYRSLGLAKMLVNTALEWASKHPELVYNPPDPTAMEEASRLGSTAKKAHTWAGLANIHAQAAVSKWWHKHFGFDEELKDENGEVEIGREPRWMEEGIEHLGMWKRLALDEN